MKNIDDLIKMGDTVLETSDEYIVDVLDATEWIQLSKNYIHRVMKDNYQLRLFSEVADKPLFGEGTAYHLSQIKRLIAILKACKEFPQEYREVEDEYIILRQMLTNFHKFVVTSKRRYSDRGDQSNQFKDEYDVQDGIEAILRLIFHDVRREDYTPSRAGGNSRSDFFIRDISTVLEIKFVSGIMNDKKLGEEIIVDTERYKGNTEYEKFLFFIYDPDSKIKNPQGLKDVEKNNKNIEIIIVP